MPSHKQEKKLCCGSFPSYPAQNIHVLHIVEGCGECVCTPPPSTGGFLNVSARRRLLGNRGIIHLHYGLRNRVKKENLGEVPASCPRRIRIFGYGLLFSDLARLCGTTVILPH